MPDVYSSGQGQESGHKGHRHTHAGLFSAYANYPVNVHFENQGDGEEIILFLRSHIITNVPWILIALLLFAAPRVLSFFPIIDFLPERFQFVSIIFWYLLAVAFVIEKSLNWLFNVYIVTNERVVDVDFYNIVYKEVSDAQLGKIQDVTYKLGGVVRTIFHYGDVFVQTAGTEPNIEFLGVPNPERVVRVLRDLREGKSA